MDNMVIHRIDNANDCFYRLVGPLLGNRQAIKELGGPIYDDPGKQWFVATQDGAALGICAMRLYRIAEFCSDYTVPRWRNQGVYRELFKARLLHFRGYGLKAAFAMATPKSLPVFLANGFRVVRQFKNFTRVELGGPDA